MNCYKLKTQQETELYQRARSPSRLCPPCPTPRRTTLLTSSPTGWFAFSHALWKWTHPVDAFLYLASFAQHTFCECQPCHGAQWGLAHPGGCTASHRVRGPWCRYLCSLLSVGTWVFSDLGLLLRVHGWAFLWVTFGEHVFIFLLGMYPKGGNSGSFRRVYSARNLLFPSPVIYAEGSYGILGLEGASRNMHLARGFLILPSHALGAQGSSLRGLGGALGPLPSAWAVPLLSGSQAVLEFHTIFVLRMSPAI